MTKTKKAQVLLYGVLAGLLAAIIIPAVSETGSRKSFNIIGEYSLILLKYSKEAEKALFYIDQAAKYALQQSIYELAQNGGYVSEFEINEFNVYQPFVKNNCGKFRDVFIWYEMRKDASGKNIKYSCIDESREFLDTNLKYYFNKNLNQYIIASPYNILTNNYGYEIKNNIEVIGKAKSPLIFDILKDETKPVIKEPIEIQVEQLILKDFTNEKFNDRKICAKGSKCLLTEEAYELLLEAEKLANKEGKLIVVNSAFRTQEEQIAIWKKLESTYPKVEDRRKKACDPYNEKCPHPTGNAVDVLFYGKTTKTMSNIDWIDLHNIMSAKGWIRYGDERNILSGEPWHYECCGTSRYNRAKEMEAKTGKKVTAIV